MVNIFKVLSESLGSVKVPYVIHKHDPRSGSIHFDIRFLDNRDSKLLHSFAAPSNFLDTVDKKTLVVKTRDHDPRWLTLKSYRLQDIEHSMVTIKISSYKYFELEFHGKVLNGSYKLFKMSNTFRSDRWLLVKNS